MSETEESSGLVDEKYLIFSIQGRQYAFQSRLISEIALFDYVYPLPLVPPYVLGIINRYSVPYALFDVKQLLSKTPLPESSPGGKVLVIKDEIDRIAFLIDDVTAIEDVPQELIMEVERSAEANDMAEAVSASFNLTGSNVFVLDIQRIIACVTAEVG